MILAAAGVFALGRAVLECCRGGAFMVAGLEALGCAACVGLAAMLHRSHQRLRRTLAESDGRGALLLAAEEAVKVSNDRYHRAVAMTGEGVWEADLVTDRVYHSARCREMLGLKDEVMTGSWAWFQSIVHPDDSARVFDTIGRSLASGDPYTVEMRLRPAGQANGRAGGAEGADPSPPAYRWFRSHASITLDGSGKALRISGAMRDITEERRTAEELALSESRYRGIVEDQTDLVCRWRPDGTLTFVNGAYCRFFGKEPGELVGRSFIPLVLENDRAMIGRAAARLLAGEQMITHEHRVATPAGAIRWQRWTNRLISTSTPGEVEFQAVGVDITDLKQAESELRTSVNRFQALARLAPVGIVQSDRDGRNTYVNEHWQSLTGLSAEQALGNGWERVIHPDDLPRVRTTWDEARSHARDYRSEHRYLHPDGRVIWATALARPLRDERGRIQGYLGAISDITALKEAESRLRDSLRQQEDLAGRERLLRRELDHRVRNNLAGLLGLVRIYRGAADPTRGLGQVEGKLLAMREVHELIAAADGRDVELRRLVAHMAALCCTDGQAALVRIEDSPGAVQASHAAPLAIILQELFTNSLKHGVMRGASGHVTVDWAPGISVNSTHGFTLRWIELDTVAHPLYPRSGGIGMGLIRGFARAELQGDCDFRFEPAGLRFELRAGVPLQVSSSARTPISGAAGIGSVYHDPAFR